MGRRRVAGALPPGNYRLAAVPAGADASRMALGWALGTYSFDLYRKKKKEAARRGWSGRRGPIAALVERLAGGGMPGARPDQHAGLGSRARTNWPRRRRRSPKAWGREHRVITGDALLAENYPTIHAVGRASTRAPRLVDIVWGDESAPKVTLVGKGVCFDTGGLDLKPASGMKMMKKDMGGAAIMLGLAQAIMAAQPAGAAARAVAAGRELGIGQCDAAARHRHGPARG